MLHVAFVATQTAEPGLLIRDLNLYLDFFKAASLTTSIVKSGRQIKSDLIERQTYSFDQKDKKKTPNINNLLNINTYSIIVARQRQRENN